MERHLRLTGRELLEHVSKVKRYLAARVAPDEVLDLKMGVLETAAELVE